MQPWAIKQIIFILISLIVLFCVVSLNIKIIYNFSYKSLFVSLCLLALVIPFGRKILGASRWLDFGVIMFQPSEIAKVTIILSLARFFSRMNVKNFSNFVTKIRLAIFFSPTLFLVALQPDLATSIIILAIIIIMVFAVGFSIRNFIVAGLLIFISIPICWLKFLKEYQKLRIINFLFPENDPLGSGYNVIQSKIAVGSGGFFGKGFLEGTQGRLRFLPEHHTDFIFTTIGEEFGFVGSVVLIVMYLYLIFYGFKVSSKSNSVFCKLVAIGCSSLLFLHLFINIGMTISLLPVAGIPLIMLSYGGSGMMLGVICVALIINIDINKNML